MNVEVIFDDILNQDVDAIINPANTHMLHGGGLAATIAYRGGPELVKASQALAPINTGEAIVTTAGKLPFEAVIHTVGPVWASDDHAPYWRKNSNEEDPDDLLYRAHQNAMRLAAIRGFQSLAFPAVSCGVFRFPVERAAPIAIKAVREADTSGVEKVMFCLLDDEHFEAFERANLEE